MAGREVFVLYPFIICLALGAGPITTHAVEKSVLVCFHTFCKTEKFHGITGWIVSIRIVFSVCICLGHSHEMGYNVSRHRRVFG